MAWQDDLPSDLVIRRSARAKRINLRISNLDGRVILTIPKGAREDEALAFARSKADWIAHHRSKRPSEIIVGFGAEVPILGTPHRIVPATGKAIRRAPGEIAVPSGHVGKRLAVWFKEHARRTLAEASDKYARALDKPIAAIQMRDTRSRWGSCSSAGRLMFSWRLVMMPMDVLRYVAAHEVAHLAEMNHSPAFWQTVERLYGPYQAPRTWLRQNGGGLHRYRFDD